MKSDYKQIDEIESKEIELQGIDFKEHKMVDNEFQESAPDKKKKIVYLLTILLMGIIFTYSFFSLYFINHFFQIFRSVSFKNPRVINNFSLFI